MASCFLLDFGLTWLHTRWFLGIPLSNRTPTLPWSNVRFYLSEILPFQSAWSIEYIVRPLFMSWVGIRNYVFISLLL